MDIVLNGYRWSLIDESLSIHLKNCFGFSVLLYFVRLNHHPKQIINSPLSIIEPKKSIANKICEENLWKWLKCWNRFEEHNRESFYKERRMWVFQYPISILMIYSFTLILRTTNTCAALSSLWCTIRFRLSNSCAITTRILLY